MSSKKYICKECIDDYAVGDFISKEATSSHFDYCNRTVAGESIADALTSSEWQPSVFLNGDIAEKVTQIKKQPGPDLHVWGSGNLLQTLIKHDLIDVFWLMIYPLTLGSGKRLFADGTIPAAFKVTESIVGSNGVIVVNYERAGAITTGSQ